MCSFQNFEYCVTAQVFISLLCLVTQRKGMVINMDKQQFNKITKETFLEYGFVKQKNLYFLYLNEITIIVKFCSWRGVKSFNYWFFLNNLYDSSVKFEEKYDTMIEIKMEHNSELRGYHKHEILFEEWTEEEYRELLNKMLHSYFDPYKADALQFLKDNDYRMALSKKARIYLRLV